MSTHLPFELHASHVYTNAIFKDVQEEIYECLYRFSRERIEPFNEGNIHFVKHHNQNKNLVGEFKVTHNTAENSFSCSCRLYTRIGFLCRHVFCVFKLDLVSKIPYGYIHPRWRNDVLSSSMFKIEYRYGAPLDENSKLRQEFIVLTNQCAERARSGVDLLKAMVEQMKEFKDNIWQAIPNEPSCNNNSLIIQYLLEVKEPEANTVTAPNGIRTKGSGKRRKNIGPGEKARKKGRNAEGRAKSVTG